MPTATWEKLPDERRQRVVDAALREFGSRGFSAGSLNTIARDAGVAKGSLFQYFEDKLDLFAHVCEACSQRVRNGFVVVLEQRQAEHPDDLWAFLRAVLTDWVSYFRDHEVERAVTFAATFEIDAEARRAVRSVTDHHYISVLEPLLAAAQADGQLRPSGSRDHLLAVLLLLLPHLATAPSAPELDPVLGLAKLEADDLERTIGGFVDLLRAAYAPTLEPIP